MITRVKPDGTLEENQQINIVKDICIAILSTSGLLVTLLLGFSFVGNAVFGLRTGASVICVLLLASSVLSVITLMALIKTPFSPRFALAALAGQLISFLTAIGLMILFILRLLSAA